MTTITKGFYKKYDHDKNGPLGNKTFELMGIAHSTSKKGDRFFIFRPLDPSMYVYKEGMQWDAKLLEDWFLPAYNDGKNCERYKLVTDEKEIAMLEELRDALYANEPKELKISNR